MDAVEQRHAIHSIHAQIRNHHLRLARPQPAKGLIPAFREVYVETGLSQSQG
jgi:hypothetical protein